MGVVSVVERARHDLERSDHVRSVAVWRDRFLAGTVGADRRSIRVFVIGYALLVLTMCFLVAPFSGMDEGAHYFRAVSISRGELRPIARAIPGGANWSGRGGFIDVEAFRAERRAERMAPDNIPHQGGTALWHGLTAPAAGRDIFAFHTNTAIYSPLMYAPQSAAIALGRSLGIGPTAWLYAGRCAGALAFCLLLWLALSISPETAGPLALVAVFPTAVFQATTLTCDTLLIGGALVYAAGLARVLGGRELKPRHVAFLLLGTILAATGKLAYLGLALVLPLLGHLAGRRRHAGALIGVAVAAVVVFAGWSFVIRHDVIPVRYDIDADPHRQFGWMTSHPVAAAKTILTSALLDFWPLLIKMVGFYLGGNAIKVPTKATIPLLIILLALIGARVAVGRNQRTAAVLAVLFAASYVAITAMLYMQWTVVGAPRVDGVQGRYLLPLVIPFLALPRLARTSAGGPSERSPTMMRPIPLPLMLVIGLVPLWEVVRLTWLR